jgi:hypothetical protein
MCLIIRRWIKWMHFLRSRGGHDFGWYVEMNGVRIAELVNPDYTTDQFWIGFTVVPLTNEKITYDQLNDDLFWSSKNLWLSNRRIEGVRLRFLIRCISPHRVIVRGPVWANARYE